MSYICYHFIMLTSSWSIGDSKSLVESGPFHSQGRGGVSNHYHYHWEGWVIIVGKTRRRRRHLCAIFQACCVFLAIGHVRTVLFVFWSNLPFNGISCYFEANFKFLLLCYFIVWACAIFYAFSNYDMTVESNELIEMSWHQNMRKRREQLPFCPI